MAVELATARRREHGTPLLVGRRLRCPRCETEQDLLAYFVFARDERYEDQLNVVFKCRAKIVQPDGRKEACRNVFSLSEPLPEADDA